jgi:glycosyltransferase involved in cell wall biosynthesis
MIHRKGHDILIKSIHGLENIELYIVGGKPPKEIIALVETLKLSNVKIIDFMEKDQLKEYYYLADIFVLATREDEYGLVINEAMAAGLPIITTINCGAGTELVEEGINGYLVNVDDVEMLRGKILKLYKNRDLRLQIGQQNIKKIGSYTFENWSKIMTSYLKRIKNS